MIKLNFKNKNKIKNTNNLKKEISIFTYVMSFVFLLIAVIPSTSFAQNVVIGSDKVLHNAGDTFLVKVTLNSLGKQINSLGGTILIPKDLYDVKEIMIGESFVSLWTERPEIKTTPEVDSTSTEISFSGGLPGGYSGSDGVIFTFVLKAKNKGASAINIKDFTAFLNDGKGTLASSVQITPLSGTVKNDPSLPNEIYTIKEDNTPPEQFEPSIARDPSIENNRYFISFFAVDKGTGIKSYDVEEDPILLSVFGYKKVWKDSVNPQILYFQKWGSNIKVIATDMDGNSREEIISKPFALEYKIYFFLLLLTFLFTFHFKRIKKWYNKKQLKRVLKK